MDLADVLYMSAGNQECSYADNSTVQKNAILGSKKVLEDTIKDYGTQGFSECFNLADLACSCGPNAFLSVANIIHSVRAVCQEKDLKPPNEFQVFLNDLPNNDFNSLFKMTPAFYSKLENENGHENSLNCFISGVPGSFYTRLFPTKSLHFVHSSYGVHWLSQIPEKLPDNNKGSVYLAKSSPLGVHEAYFNQFKRDFTTFLHMRSVEIIPDGRMVLTLIGRTTSKDHNAPIYYGLLDKSLQDMLAQGLLQEKDINSFNLPVYHPCTHELEAIIESEGSFRIDRLETFEIDMHNEDEIIKSGESSGKFIAKILRAVTEPLLTNHFGNTCNMDKLFDRYAMHATDQLSAKKIACFSIVVSLTRKCNN